MEPVALSLISRGAGWVRPVEPPGLLPEVAHRIGLRAFKGRGQPGVVAALSEEHGVSRPAVYRLREKVARRWNAFEERGWAPPFALTVEVDRAQVIRATVGARVDANCSIRQIMALQGHFYGLDVSFGFVQGTVSQTSRAAGDILEKQPLAGIESAALDELFSQQEPVFVGIDLETEYLFLLQLAPDRSAATWKGALDALKPRGLSLKNCVSDAGKGVVYGAMAAFPEADSRRDPFHVLDGLLDALHREERYAYSRLQQVYDAEPEVNALGRALARQKQIPRKGPGRPPKTPLQERFEEKQAALNALREQAEGQIARHDDLLMLIRRTLDALQPVGLDGTLRTSQTQSEELAVIADELVAMRGTRLAKAATYLRNCAAAVCSYIDDVVAGLRILATGPEELQVVIDTAVLWRLGQEENQRTMLFRHEERLDCLRRIIDELSGLPLDSDRIKKLMSAAERVIERRARASSLAECLNSVLRPYLAVHKRVTQEALDLFCAKWNFQIRTSGKLKGTSPFTALTGIHVHDWISMLGAHRTAVIN